MDPTEFGENLEENPSPLKMKMQFSTGFGEKLRVSKVQGFNGK